MFIFLLTSCDLDNDDSFYPQSKRSFLLVSDSDQKQLVIIEEHEISYHQEQALGLGPSLLTDMAGENNHLWLGLNSSELLQVDAGTKSIILQKSLDGLIPHHIVIGVEYLLLIDTVNNKLGFWEKKKQNLIHTIDLQKKPASATYLSGKFYIHLGKRHIGVLREVALLITHELEVPNETGPIQSSSTSRLYVYSLQKPLTPYWIDYNIDSEIRTGRTVTFDQIFHSPYTRQQYGKEWLQNIELREGYMISSLERDSIFSEVDWAAIDFFEGKAWLISQGNLLNITLSDHSVQGTWPFTDSIEKVWTYVK